MNDYPKMLYKGGKLSASSADQAIAYDADHEQELAAQKFVRVDMNDEKEVEKKQKLITGAVQRRRDRIRAEREAQARADAVANAKKAETEDDMYGDGV